MMLRKLRKFTPTFKLTDIFVIVEVVVKAIVYLLEASKDKEEKKVKKCSEKAMKTIQSAEKIAKTAMELVKDRAYKISLENTARNFNIDRASKTLKIIKQIKED